MAGAMETVACWQGSPARSCNYSRIIYSIQRLFELENSNRFTTGQDQWNENGGTAEG